MPRLFLTKTWGWNPEIYPTFGFSTEGGRHHFLRQSDRDDWIVIAGTMTEETQAHERGRLLGMCRTGRDLVNAHEILRELGVVLRPSEIDQNTNQYRWPWALPILEAVKFDDPLPDLQETVGSNLPGFGWVKYANDVARHLGDDAVERILAIPRHPCIVSAMPKLDRERAYNAAVKLHQKWKHTGPGPHLHRRATFLEMGAGHAYAFKIEGGAFPGAVKIGYTRDIDRRFAQLNKDIHPELTQCRWKHLYHQVFESVQHAFNFEQLLHRKLRLHGVTGEREIVVIDDTRLSEHWTNIFFRGNGQIHCLRGILLT